MLRLLLPLSLLFLPTPDEEIRAKDIQAHVDFLASDRLQGRFARSDEAREAARYVAKHFQEHGLVPLGDDGTWFQALEDEALAPNVVGMVRGSGAGYVLLTAHYDHLEPAKEGEDRIYNGADDNASGTAAVLELARAFARRDQPLEASVVFVAFTAEELGLRGSRHFVGHPPFPLEEIRGVINMDMISRGKEDLIFCEGGENAALRKATERVAKQVGLRVRFDEHPEWRGASDHGPFMQRGVPTLYFGVEDHEDYHEVSDHADRILAELAARVARLAYGVVEEVAGPAPPAGEPAEKRG